MKTGGRENWLNSALERQVTPVPRPMKRDGDTRVIVGRGTGATSNAGSIPALLILVMGILITGCTVSSQTVVPKTVVTTQASFDGSQQNSGIIGVEHGNFIVTSHFVERWHSLCEKYGHYLSPQPCDNRGISEHVNDFLMTPEAMSRFRLLNHYRKQDLGSP